jgi:hypothetical protein
MYPTHAQNARTHQRKNDRHLEFAVRPYACLALPLVGASSGSQGNSRMARVHPVSASKTELPQPEAKNGATFWLISLSACAKNLKYCPGGGAANSFTVIVKSTSTPLTHFLNENRCSCANSSDGFFCANLQSLTKASTAWERCGTSRTEDQTHLRPRTQAKSTQPNRLANRVCRPFA